MTSLDFIAVILYFAVVAAIGYWSSKKSLKDSNSYFLAGKGVGWMAIGASLFASNISAEHFIGLAGTGASSGFAVGQFEWLACLILLLLGWLFVPLYLRIGVFTMPEFLERRYNRQCRTYLASVSLLAYIFTKISVAVFAGALVLKVILGWNIWVGAILLIVSTGIYTVFGGLLAVIYTDFLQAFILIAGAIVLTVISVLKAGGMGIVVGVLEPSFFSVWHPMSHPDFPWTGILFGAPILGVWYWCTDQMIVQRTLSAKSIPEAQKATIFAGFLKILPVFILVLPGMAGRIIFPEVEANLIYPTMVNTLLPSGIKGLVIAALLAALMSSLSSVFNSSSTLFVMDFYKRWYPKSSERELVRAGQFATIGLVITGLLWLPFLGFMSEQLYVYLQSVQAYIAPPIAVVFLLGILWKRGTAKAAILTLYSGFVLGAIRFGSEVAVKGNFTSNALLKSLVDINFLHFAVLLAVISLVVFIGVSLVTTPPDEQTMEMFRAEAVARDDAGDTQINIVLSGILVCIVLGLWVYFSPLVFT
ncbi:sodium/solute symporter [bacterium]|jgi:solute:Na+ symporter, SSS family|nr:sodium/solute symporter [bacterium]